MGTFKHQAVGHTVFYFCTWLRLSICVNTAQTEINRIKFITEIQRLFYKERLMLMGHYLREINVESSPQLNFYRAELIRLCEYEAKVMQDVHSYDFTQEYEWIENYFATIVGKYANT